MPTPEAIREKLFSLQDIPYRDFTAKLLNFGLMRLFHLLKKHKIKLDLTSIDISVIVHDHAHHPRIDVERGNDVEYPDHQT